VTQLELELAPAVDQSKRKREADRATFNAAMTLCLALPGDTVLYLLLPIHAAAFGVTLPEVGLLLAANRLVRIVGYNWVAGFYARRGPKAACILAGTGAVLAATVYASASGLWLLLVARLIWGLSFAANSACQALEPLYVRWSKTTHSRCSAWIPRALTPAIRELFRWRCQTKSTVSGVSRPLSLLAGSSRA
jgi:MFS family permease